MLLFVLLLTKQQSVYIVGVGVNVFYIPYYFLLWPRQYQAALWAIKRLFPSSFLPSLVLEQSDLPNIVQKLWRYFHLLLSLLFTIQRSNLQKIQELWKKCDFLNISEFYVTKNGKFSQRSKHFRNLKLCMVNNSDKRFFFRFHWFRFWDGLQ